MGIEIVALQPKSPFMAPARAIEGQEQFKTLNINGFPVILFNDVDDEAPEGLQEIKPPFRLDPPKPSEAHERGMQTAERQMMMISGQYENTMGQAKPDAAASGVAIGERKEQGETATYHFVEHFGDMLRNVGTQLIDLIPKIYDTQRALHILGDDGEKQWIMIDPNQDEVVKELEHEKEDEEAIRLAFNPSMGEYECVSDPGPDTATARQEAWSAMSMILQQNMELAGVIGDLLFKNGDFKGAEDISERLQKEIKATKPYLFDESKDPGLAALQQQIQQLTDLNKELLQRLAEERLKLKGREEKRDIDAFNADTNRMKAEIEALTKVMLTPQQKAQFQHELEKMGHQHVYDSIAQANQADIDGQDEGSPTNGQNGGPETQEPPMEGAKQAPDGGWYLPDVARPGKYLKVLM